MINLCKPDQIAHEEAIVSLNYPGGIIWLIVSEF